MKRNCDSQQYGRDLLRTIKTFNLGSEWGNDFLCFILLVLTVYILPYYAVTKPNDMTYASLVSPPCTSCLWLSLHAKAYISSSLIIATLMNVI